jgi:flagellar biosynthesis protein FliQ
LQGFANDSTPEIGEQSLKYIGRIFFAFVLMFILGGLFTVALENLPRLILLFNNSFV